MAQPIFPPRYSTFEFPPYSYVPGFTPHPFRNGRGQLPRYRPEHAQPLDPGDWFASDMYRYAIDLFNCGYYWEAHEAWESLWHAAERRGRVATWLKALIKLAAAAVKLREGNVHGANHHARRSLELLGEFQTHAESDTVNGGSVITHSPASIASFCGIDLPQLAAIAAEIAAAVSVAPQPNPTFTLQHRLTLQV